MADTRSAGENITLKLPGDVPITFAWCPPGSFQMGSEHPEVAIIERSRNERPVHQVTLTTGFFMGIHPVTQDQWEAVMGTDPSHFKGPNRPVENVTWDECREFCRKLTAHLSDRVTVRLPTEAEWEYACRAGTATEYHFGDVLNTDLTNYSGKLSWNGSPEGMYREGTTEVGSFPANGWGLHDVHGNVWEWCEDRYGPYADKAQTDPQPQSYGRQLILRGGAWCNGPDFSRAACRSRDQHNYYGFRVCFHLESSTGKPADAVRVEVPQATDRAKSETKHVSRQRAKRSDLTG